MTKINILIKDTLKKSKLFMKIHHNMSKEYNKLSNIQFQNTEGIKLKKFKDIHKGERCFIIGNGPSINQQDLTKLSDDIKFATNNFLLHKSLKKINLNYFCVSDPLHWKNGQFPRSWQSLFNELNNCVIFLEKSSKSTYMRTPELTYLDTYFLNLDLTKQVFRGDFSSEVHKYTCWGRTVIIDFCLPLAFYFGFKEIYLLGCDCTYNYKGNISCLKSNYFYESSMDDRNLYLWDPDEWFNYVIDSYTVTKKYFESHGRKIFNAGAGGRLDVFDRVNFDELF